MPFVAVASYPSYVAGMAHVEAQDQQQWHKYNELQRWQHTFDVRGPVISASNFLLVFLLKLNRIVVPAVVRWMRTRRLEWIQRADVDVARELHDHPNKRELCAGACCRDTYGSAPAEGNDIETGRSASPTKSNESTGMGPDVSELGDGLQKCHSSTGTMVTHMESWVSAFKADETDSEDSDAEGTRRRQVYQERLAKRIAAKTANPEEDIYYRLRVAQEERHREMFIGQFNYSEVVAMYVTLIALIVYSSMIITYVLTHFDFTIREAWIFSVSLIMTGITSEIDTLMMFQRRVRAGAKHMLPEMPGYYALQSTTESARLMATKLMEGVEKNAERIKKRSKKRRSRARRGPEVLPLNEKEVPKYGAEGATTGKKDVEAAS